MEYPVLELIKINKRLSDYFALKDISLELHKGEIHVITGENGSGKSSLMNIIWGTYTKDSGSIFIDGASVSIHSPVDAKGLGIAMIHQNSTLFEHFTVVENVYIDRKPYLNKSLRIIDWTKMFSDCQKLFNDLGFPLNSRDLIKDLSVAQRQLVEICKAYVSEARIIIMDEPTTSLTETETTILFKILRELKKSGVSILYISHRLEEIIEIGDQVTVLHDGKIVGTEAVGNMDVDGILHMMIGKELKERYPKLNIKLGKEILKTQNLCAGNAVKNISFSLKKKEILGVIGHVGSGRTKIAKCLFGLEKLDAGEILIEGKKVGINSPADAIKAGIGYVTEDRHSEGLFMYLNVPENISAPNISKVSNKFLIDREIEKKIAVSYIDRLGIKVGTIHDKAAYLSGGNQQKVILAKWIMSKSRILIFDEPTKGIDIASKVDVYNLMNEMVTKDVSIILISSDVDEVIGMCDRIMVLYGGEIAAVIPKDEATREKIIYYATGGKHNQ